MGSKFLLFSVFLLLNNYVFANQDTIVTWEQDCPRIENKDSNNLGVLYILGDFFSIRNTSKFYNNKCYNLEKSKYFLTESAKLGYAPSQYRLCADNILGFSIYPKSKYYKDIFQWCYVASKNGYKKAEKLMQEHKLPLRLNKDYDDFKNKAEIYYRNNKNRLTNKNTHKRLVEFLINSNNSYLSNMLFFMQKINYILEKNIGGKLKSPVNQRGQ